MENIVKKLEEQGIVEKGVYSAAFEITGPGTYMVVKNGKYGVINTAGVVKIPPKYISIAFEEGKMYKCFGNANKLWYTDTYDSNFNLV